jgi:hypothetical protein
MPETKYTKEIGEAICLGISQGHSLRKICNSSDIFPAVSTVCLWAITNDEFAEQYARARRIQAELLADEIIALSDDDSKDVSGELQMPNGVAVQRSRLSVDTRKWYLSKVLPKVYGDKVLNEHTGKDGGALQIEFKSVIDDVK